MVQLTESSSISGRTDAHRVHRVLTTNASMLAGVRATETDGCVTGGPTIARRTCGAYVYVSRKRNFGHINFLQSGIISVEVPWALIS